MTTSLRSVLAGLAIAVAAVPVVAGPADAAAKHRRPKITKKATKTTAVKTTKTVTAPVPAPAPTPAAAPAPTVNSVISIGGYVFYNLTYAEAVAAYQAAVANAPAGYTPPPVTSISIDTTVGGNV